MNEKLAENDVATSMARLHVIIIIKMLHKTHKNGILFDVDHDMTQTVNCVQPDRRHRSRSFTDCITFEFKTKANTSTTR